MQIPIFYLKKDPVSKHISPLNIETIIIGEKIHDKSKIIIGVIEPITNSLPMF